MQLERLIFAALVGLFAANAHCALYKWVDDKGRVQYSDKPPADSGKGGVEMSNRGVIKKKLDGGLTPEEKRAKEEEAARRRAAQEEALAQRRADNALLQSFTSAAEIDMKRDRELQALDAMISNLKSQERSLLERWNDDKRRADHHAKSSKPLPDGLKQDLTRSEGEVRTVREEIQRRHQESNEVRTKYEGLRKRYIELRQPTSTIDAAAAPALPPAKSSTKK